MRKIIFLILLIGFLGSIFLIYKDLNTNDLNKGYYLVQSYFFIFIVILSIIILYFNKNVQRYFLISLTSIFISLYLFEFYVFKSGGIKFFTSAEDHWQNDIIFHKKRIKKENALSSFSLTNEEIISFSGISNSKIVFCKESDSFSMYISDRYGFNNPDSVWDNRADVVVLGDSFVHGACVNSGDDLTSQLRKLGNLNAINLGWSNTGVLRQYASFIEYVQDYPEYIVWVYYENDLDNLETELTNKILRQYLDNVNFRQYLTLDHKRKIIDEGILKKHLEYMKTDHVIDTRVKSYTNFINFLKLYKTRKMILSLFKDFSKVDENFQLNKYENLLNKYFLLFDRIKNKAYKNNTEILFVYLPTGKYHFSNREKIFKKVKKKLKHKMSEENIKFVDIEKEIYDSHLFPLKLYAYNSMDFHFNEDGYNFVAKNILKYLNENR